MLFVLIDRYLTQRPNSRFWQLRVPVPQDVQGQFGRKEVTRSLRETDKSKASLAALPIITQLNEQWDELRASQNLSAKSEGKKRPSPQDVHTLVAAAFDQALEKASALHRGLGSQDIALVEQRLAASDRNQAKLANQLLDGDVTRLHDPVVRMLAARNLHLDPSDSNFADIATKIGTAVADAVSVANEQRRGKLSAAPQSEVVRHAKAVVDAQSGMISHQSAPASQVIEGYMRQWVADPSHKSGANTEQQLRATFRLFAEFMNDAPLAECSQQRVSDFYDKLRCFDPAWARSPNLRRLSWHQLINRFEAGSHRLADGTMNRHIGSLKSLWDWARPRGYCSGDNPFGGLHRKLRPGVNVDQYLAWEDAELNQLLSPPPPRRDLLEVMIVGLFSGMRLDEIASLTWQRLVPATAYQPAYFVVTDAKTVAGNRQVPVHSALSWLLTRDRGPADARVWPSFNLEGKGKTAGADAGRMFSDFKKKKGFTERRKAFHSFRKNVTRIMEQAGVPENDWAQVFGHERGFTYGRYNPDGIRLERKRQIIELIAYPNVTLPEIPSN